MHRTTLFLPDGLRRALKAAVEGRKESEASFIRRALARAVAEARPPRPRLPLFSSGDKTLAERLDGAMKGFGKR